MFFDNLALCRLYDLGRKGLGDAMTISIVTEIFDNGEFVTLVLGTGSIVHLPMKSVHSITVMDMPDNPMVVVNVDLYAG